MSRHNSMMAAVVAALKDAQIMPRDAAAVHLIREYARLIDNARGKEDEIRVCSDLGPKLLAALTALGMTAVGRGAKGGQVAGPVAGKLDELRARREQRGRAG